eukprot:262621-Chlamydomonas_euryale.AAC.2
MSMPQIRAAREHADGPASHKAWFGPRTANKKNSDHADGPASHKAWFGPRTANKKISETHALVVDHNGQMFEGPHQQQQRWVAGQVTKIDPHKPNWLPAPTSILYPVHRLLAGDDGVGD